MREILLQKNKLKTFAGLPFPVEAPEWSLKMMPLCMGEGGGLYELVTGPTRTDVGNADQIMAARTINFGDSASDVIEAAAFSAALAFGYCMY